jgi:hypothetical protein
MAKNILDTVTTLEAMAMAMLNQCHEVKQQLQVSGGGSRPAPREGRQVTIAREERDKIRATRLNNVTKSILKNGDNIS